MNALRASKAITSTSRVLLAARAASTTASPIRSSTSAVPLANVEAQWNSLSAEEQVDVHRELEELQKRDWKTLSLDEKKAGELVPDPYLLDFFHTMGNAAALRDSDLILPCMRTDTRLFKHTLSRLVLMVPARL